MNEPTTTQTVLFPDLFDKPLVARFDQPHGSSDGGAILLKAVDQRLGLTGGLAACLRDKRQASKIDHELVDLFRQRVFAIACGYADCNDAARLADDPIHKMLVGPRVPPRSSCAQRTTCWSMAPWPRRVIAVRPTPRRRSRSP